MKTDGDSLSRTYEYWDGELKLTDTFTLETDILTYPALEGLTAFDEPWAGTAEVDAISSARSKFDTLKANAGRDDLIFFVNLLPEHSSDDKFVSDSNTGGKYGYSLDTDYLENYVKLVHSAGSIKEYVSWDDYSLIRDTSTGTKVGIRPDYFHGFEEMVSLGKPAWYTMLSAGHTLNGTTVYYTEPTTQELRWQMAVAMSFGVSDINHYTYTSHETAYNYTTMFDYNSNAVTDLYYRIKDVDNEYLAWDEIFMAYDYVDTKAVSLSSRMTALESTMNLADHGISSISSSSGGLLVGVFQNNGNKAYMVTNAGSASTNMFFGSVGDGREFTMNGTTVTLNLTGCSKVAVIDQGEVKVYSVTNNSVQIPVDAYEGVFVIPVA